MLPQARRVGLRKAQDWMVWLDPGPDLLGEAPQPALAARARPREEVPQGGLAPMR